MSISLEKLRQLWLNRGPLLREHGKFVTRVERIYRLAEEWESEPVMAAVATSMAASHPGPAMLGIPSGESWWTVRNGFHGFYAGQPDLQGHVQQIDDVFDLLHVGSRDGNFRLASGSRGYSPHENDNTEASTFQNPDAWFPSHHFPFEVIDFYLSCKTAAPNLSMLRRGQERFVTKFLWMFANRERYVPILSLRSYYNLAPLFDSWNSAVAWHNPGGNWALPLPDFAATWPAAAARLHEEIVRGDQPAWAALADDERRKFATFLFIASMKDSDADIRNALAMVKTGNQAMIFYGPPGTGKTFSAKRVARQLLAEHAHAQAQKFLPGNPPPGSTPLGVEDENATGGVPPSAAATPTAATSEALAPGTNWRIVQFHPSYSYQDFIGGIAPNIDETSGQIRYELRKGIFKRVCEAAAGLPGDYPFVLIIDEINRASVATVFGELLYALEYRDEPIDIPYFGEFSVPSNVYVIGTMNTVDTSLENFDLALRRRFLFMKLPPDMETLYDWNETERTRASAESIADEDVTELVRRAQALNQALTSREGDGLGLTEEYGIGQAYFMKIRDFCEGDGQGARCITELAWQQLWFYHLEPLIEEYLGAEFRTRKASVEKLRAAFIKGASAA